MTSGRTLALGGILLVALGATVLLVGSLLGDRTPATPSAPDDAPDALLLRAEEPAEAPALEGRSDARPLRTASFAALLEDVGPGEGDTYEAAVRELRERARGDAALVRRLVARLDGPGWYSVLQVLQAIGAPAALPLAEYALGADGHRRVATFDALVTMGPEAAPAVDLLFGRLEALEDARLRRPILGVLGAIGPAARVAVPLLLALLAPPLDDLVAGDAARALASIDGQDPATLEALRTALLDEETLSRPVVLQAIASLGRGAEAFLPLVIELLEDPEEGTRYEAAAALGEIGTPSKVVLDALASMLEHDHAMGQRVAAAALIALGPAGVRALARVAARVEDIDVRLSAAQVLLRVEGQSEACARVLVSVLQEECDKGWKQRALAFFARLDPPPPAELVLPAILRALEDPTLAKNACQALANVPGEEAHAALVEVLGRTDAPELGLSALNALLGSLADDPRRDVLLASLLKPGTSPALVKGTLMRLQGLRPAGQSSVLLPALEPWLASEEVTLRAYAHQSLARLTGDEGVRVDRLLDGLGDPEIVWSCSNALRYFPKHASRSVPALVDALLALPEGSPYRFGLSWTTTILARSWPGARAHVEGRRDAADEGQRKRLDELLARMAQMGRR